MKWLIVFVIPIILFGISQAYSQLDSTDQASSLDAIQADPVTKDIQPQPEPVQIIDNQTNPQDLPSIKTIRGSNFIDKDVGHDTHVWQSAPEWIKNSTGDYVPYLLEQDDQSIKVITADGSISFDKQTCTTDFFNDTNTNGIPLISNDTFIAKVIPVAETQWKDATDLNSKQCTVNVIQNDTGIDVVAKKDSFLNAVMEVHFTKLDGKPFETTWSVTNNNILNTEAKYGLVETFSLPNLDVNDISQLDLSNTNSIPIDDNAALDLGNASQFVSDINKNVNNSISISYLDNIPPLPVTSSFTIDPTITLSPTNQFFVQDSGNHICDGAILSNAPVAYPIVIWKNIPGNADCDRAAYQFDTSSIPDSGAISTVQLQVSSGFDGGGNERSCDINPMQSKPSGQPLINRWFDIGNGTSYVSDSFTLCGTGTIHTQTLGGSVVSDLKSRLPDNWFAVGFKTHDETISNLVTYNQYTFPSVNLIVTYLVTERYAQALEHDGLTPIFPSSIRQQNATITNTLSTNSTGWVHFTGISGNQNYTVKDLTGGYVVNKTYNVPTSINDTLKFPTNEYRISCPANGPANDVRIITNGTDGHRMVYTNSVGLPTIPLCSADNKVSWLVKFIADGRTSTSYSSRVSVLVLNQSAYAVSPSLFQVNGSNVAATYNVSNHTISSVPFTVGTGLQTRVYNITMILGNPGLPSAPVGLTATSTSTSNINLSWGPPITNGSFPITGYHITRNGTTLVNDTGSLATTYSNGGLTTNHLETYQVAAWSVALGTYSNQASNYTWTAITGKLYLNKTVVGDAIGVTPIIQVLTGTPKPIITTEQLYNLTTLNRSLSPGIYGPSQNTIGYGPTLYDAYLGGGSNSNYTVKVTLTNPVNSITISSLNATGLLSREYAPVYNDAIDATQGMVNHTLARSGDGKQIQLKVNREKNGNTFQIECLYQTPSQASSKPVGGTWDNHTNVGYLKSNYTDSTGGNTIYISCYNSGLLFTTTSFSNATLLSGIAFFNDEFGGFLGTPVFVFFILLAGGLATGRTAPTVAVIVLAIAGIGGAIGLIVIGQATWALCLVCGAICLFAGKKFL